MRLFTKVNQTEEQEVLSNTYILVLYALIMYVMYFLANWPWRWTILYEKCRKKPTLPLKDRITKTQDRERTYGVITHYVMICKQVVVTLFCD